MLRFLYIPNIEVTKIETMPTHLHQPTVQHQPAVQRRPGVLARLDLDRRAQPTASRRSPSAPAGTARPGRIRPGTRRPACPSVVRMKARKAKIGAAATRLMPRMRRDVDAHQRLDILCGLTTRRGARAGSCQAAHPAPNGWSSTTAPPARSSTRGSRRIACRSLQRRSDTSPRLSPFRRTRAPLRRLEARLFPWQAEGKAASPFARFARSQGPAIGDAMRPTIAPFPALRFRRLRRTPALRALAQENTLTVGRSDLAGLRARR